MRIPGPKKPETGTLLTNATSVSPEWYNIPKPAIPNWRKWSNMATVELWEAIALTLNIEPKFNPQGTCPDFDSRMEIALSHLQAGGELQVVERNSRLHCSRVRLADVARLAASCVPAWEVPAEFPQSVLASPPAASSGAPETAALPTFRLRIGWQIALFDAWPAMRILHGREPSPAEAIRYLKNRDASGIILKKGGDNELWWMPRRGPAKEVAFSTVENTISSWRTRGMLPA